MTARALILALAVVAAGAAAAQDLPAGTGAGVDAPAVTALTPEERTAFGIRVQSCRLPADGVVAVTVGFGLDAQGRVEGDVLLVAPALVTPSVAAAFEAARRAVLRCQGEGYPLPAAAYDSWAQVEMTFDPSGMVRR